MPCQPAVFLDFLFHFSENIKSAMSADIALFMLVRYFLPVLYVEREAISPRNVYLPMTGLGKLTEGCPVTVLGHPPSHMIMSMYTLRPASMSLASKPW